MAKFGDELDYEFGPNDLTWTITLPCTAVISIKVIPLLLSVLFKKWLCIALCERRRFVFLLPIIIGV